MTFNTTDILAFRNNILNWYDVNRRTLPWRSEGKCLQDPYKVWLSEIMLQQTTVPAVIPYFLKFTTMWPNVFALAEAEQEILMSAWAGLGYYARARNLHACARKIAYEYGGKFPENEKSLLSLPGIGEYTAAAIRSIAFDLPSTVVDGNIERIMSRVFSIATPLPAGKKEIKEKAYLLSDKQAFRCGDYAQALMDLGATVCTPKSPRCHLCPISDMCSSKRDGLQESFPVKAKKKESPKKYGYVYYITDLQGRVLLEQRDEKGLLGGMIGLPTTQWKNEDILHLDFLEGCGELMRLDFEIMHVFTHFKLSLIPHVVITEEGFKYPKNFFWVSKDVFDQQQFPTVFKKAKSIFNDKYEHRILDVPLV